jgi:hypothetical protein
MEIVKTLSEGAVVLSFNGKLSAAARTSLITFSTSVILPLRFREQIPCLVRSAAFFCALLSRGPRPNRFRAKTNSPVYFHKRNLARLYPFSQSAYLGL